MIISIQLMILNSLYMLINEYFGHRFLMFCKSTQMRTLLSGSVLSRALKILVQWRFLIIVVLVWCIRSDGYASHSGLKNVGIASDLQSRRSMCITSI